jgi:hypothetical protein
MKSDIDRARRARCRADRRERLAPWADQFSWDITVTWPRGFVGWLLKWLVFMTPVGLLLLASWLMGHRRDAWTLTAEFALLWLVSIGVEALALRLGANPTIRSAATAIAVMIAGVVFFVPSALVLAGAIRGGMRETAPPRDDEPPDEAA